MFAPGTASAARADAKVIINYYDPPPIIGTWVGKVKSERKACKKNREVILYRRAGEDNEEVGSDTTVREGNHWVWSVAAPDVEGDYFALAPPTPKCKRCGVEDLQLSGRQPTATPVLEPRQARRPVCDP